MDIPQEQMIHKSFFSENEYPAFEYGYNAVFTVENNLREIVSIAGIRPIAEVVAITNMDHPVRDRRAALITLAQALGFAASHFSYKQLHAFVHGDSKWIEHLKSMEFRESENKVLILDLENGQKELKA